MPNVKVRAGRQVSIPQSIFRRLNLKEGDVLETFDLNGSIVFFPKTLLRSKKLRKELHERLWDRMEEEANTAIAKGEISGPFDSVEKLMSHLRNQKV